MDCLMLGRALEKSLLGSPRNIQGPQLGPLGVPRLNKKKKESLGSPWLLVMWLRTSWGLLGAFWSLLGPPGSLLEPPGASWVSWGFLGSPGNLLEPPGASWQGLESLLGGARGT